MRLFGLFALSLSLTVNAGIDIPSDSGSTIYGLGAGHSIQEAERSAVANIAQKMVSNISVETRSLVEFKNGETNEEFSELMVMESDRLPIYGYRVEKQVNGDLYEVLVSIDTHQLANAYHSKLSSDITRIENIIKLAKTSEPIDALKHMLSIREELASIYTVSGALQGITKNDASHYQDRLLPLLHEASIQKSRAHVQVISDRSTTDISDYLTEIAQRIGVTSQTGTKYQIVLSGKRKQASKNGQFRVNRSIRVELRQVGMVQPIILKNYNYTSPASESYEKAEDAIYEKFLLELGSEPLDKILGV